MKIIVNFLSGILLFATIVNIIAFDESNYESIREDCGDLYNITSEEYESLTGDVSMENIEQKFKCFTYCIIKGMGYLNDEDKLNLEKLEEEGEMDDDELAQVKACKTLHDSEEDPCEYGMKIMDCAMGEEF